MQIIVAPPVLRNSNTHMKESSTNSVLKAALILSGIMLNYDVYAFRVNSIPDVAPQLYYFSIFGFALLTIFLAAFSTSNLIRYFWGLLFIVSWITHDAYTNIMGVNYLTYNAFVQFFQSRGFIQQALIQYLHPILLAIPSGTLVFLGVIINPNKKSYKFKITGILTDIAPAISIVFLSALLFVRGGNGSNGLPPGIIMPVFANLYIYEESKKQIGDRQEVAIPKSQAMKPVRDVVLIVDESIRGDYLDINSELGAYSGLNEQYENANIFNYGLAASATNCSLGSNLSLRFGGTRQEYQRYINTMPSIWQYAINAGLETVFIDAQSEDKLYNGMTDEELSKIERFIDFQQTPPVNRDIEASEVIIDLINDNIPQFILISKLGGHFPINDKFPDSHKTYVPVLHRGNLEDTPIGRLKESFNGEWELYKNSYKNTITWSIGRFFEKVINNANLDNATIIYTSDHGQNFHERGEPGLHTHCTIDTNPSIEEGLVPMVVITGKNSNQHVFQDSLAKNHNRTSHYNIFPTILNLMGFEASEVEKIYGIPLTEETDDPLTFNLLFKARFGQKPVWKTIDLEKVIRPGEKH